MNKFLMLAIALLLLLTLDDVVLTRSGVEHYGMAEANLIVQQFTMGRWIVLKIAPVAGVFLIGLVRFRLVQCAVWAVVSGLIVLCGGAVVWNLAALFG